MVNRGVRLVLTLDDDDDERERDDEEESNLLFLNILNDYYNDVEKITLENPKYFNVAYLKAEDIYEFKDCLEDIKGNDPNIYT